jgi:hypothetical protein
MLPHEIMMNLIVIKRGRRRQQWVMRWAAATIEARAWFRNNIMVYGVGGGRWKLVEKDIKDT